MWLIVGLGNPGVAYAKNRHNVGFMVIDALANKLGNINLQQGFSGLGAKSSINTNPVFLLKPQTFMNRSGQSVQQAAHFYKTEPNNIIVIHDELDIPFETIKLKLGGGHGGHNGLRDIIAHLGSDFVRVRVGIGRPIVRGSEANFVLANYDSHELAELEHQIEDACNAVESIVLHGLEKAQRTINQKQPLAKSNS